MILITMPRTDVFKRCGVELDEVCYVLYPDNEGKTLQPYR
eukprot:UN20818